MNHNMVESTHPAADQITRYYSWRASNYDAGTAFEIKHHAEALRLANIQEGQRILDVACGTGRATLGLAQAVGASGRVDALDLSEAMLGQARTKIEKNGLSDRVHFKQGNAAELPYADGAFDVVYNGYMFDLIPLNGFTPILKEMARVLKPDGKLVLVNMSKPDARRTFFERIYELGWAVMPCRPVLMSTFLEPAGFKNVERLYRPTRSGIISLLWGQEIVTANKA